MQRHVLTVIWTLLGFIALSVAALPPWLSPISPIAPVIIPRSSLTIREVGTTAENLQVLSAFKVRTALQAVPENTNCENRGETLFVSRIADSVVANPKLTDKSDSTLSFTIGDSFTGAKSKRRISFALVDSVSSLTTTQPYFGADDCNKSAKNNRNVIAEAF